MLTFIMWYRCLWLGSRSFRPSLSMNFDFDSLWARALTSGAMVCWHYPPLSLDVQLDGESVSKRKDVEDLLQSLSCIVSVVIRLVMHAIANSCI